MKSYTIHFIRNALTDENLEGRYIGDTNVEISEEGRAQLAQMREELIYPPVDAVFTSPLKRCTETAKILYLDAPDLIVEKDNEPIFSIEVTTEAGTGHNAFQRFARIAASVENCVPSF